MPARIYLDGADMKFILVDKETLIGTVDSKEGVKRMISLHFTDTGRHPTVYVNIAGKITPWGETE